MERGNEGSQLHSAFLSRTIESWIDIDAPPQRVWEVLLDLPAWKEWNPFIPLIEGRLEKGSRLRLTVVPYGRKPVEFKGSRSSEVFLVQPFEEILFGGSWLWKVFRGDHALLLEKLPNGGTRFRQRERFRGPLVLLMGSALKPTELGYRQMNRALKERVEAKARG